MRAEVGFAGLATLVVIVIAGTVRETPGVRTPVVQPAREAWRRDVSPVAIASPIATVEEQRAGGLAIDDRVAAIQAGTSGADLLATLAADDAVLVAEAVDALIARADPSAISTLSEIDVLARPEIAPSIIAALGRLGAVARGDTRTTAVMRLLELLDRERRRGAPESTGNLVQIYEALGDLRDVRAAPRLEAELADSTVGKAQKVVVVNSLVAIAAPSSRVTIEGVRDRLAMTHERDEYEAALHRELLAALDAALRALD